MVKSIKLKINLQLVPNSCKSKSWTPRLLLFAYHMSCELLHFQIRIVEDFQSLNIHLYFIKRDRL